MDETVKKIIAWGDRWPIIYHVILFLPVGALGAGYELLTSSVWGWALSTGTLLALAILIGQEWADQRAHDAIKKHHEAQKTFRKTDTHAIGWGGVMYRDRKHPEVWHGWDWRDLLGGVIGGAIGAVALVVILWNG